MAIGKPILISGIVALAIAILTAVAKFIGLF